MFSYPGVDFKLKMLTVGGKRLKLTMWDTGYIYMYMISLVGNFLS